MAPDAPMPEDVKPEELAAAHAELLAFSTKLRAAIEGVTVAMHQEFGHPVDPNVLCALLQHEVGAIVLQWGQALKARPEEVVEYHDRILRNARRGLRQQLQMTAPLVSLS